MNETEAKQAADFRQQAALNAATPKPRAGEHTKNERYIEWEADGTLTALDAQKRELIEALRECADDLEAELEGRWRSMKDHPAMQARYKRDMEPVKDARTILAKHGR